MHPSIQSYNTNQISTDQEICNLLTSLIDGELKEAESKIWHGHPVWFINGNPIVGFSKEKRGIRLMFWSGADFEEDALNILGGKFKDASIFYNQATEIKPTTLKRCLKKSRTIQWDYQSIVKRKGMLVRL